MTDDESRQAGRAGRVALLLAALGVAVVAAAASGLPALGLTLAAVACAGASFIGPLVRWLGRLLKPATRKPTRDRSSR
jgi:hypothetical protein